LLGRFIALLDTRPCFAQSSSAAERSDSSCLRVIIADYNLEHTCC